MACKTVLAGAIMMALLGGATGDALARNVAAPTVDAADARHAKPADEHRTLDTIVVTGTHLRAVDVESEHPLTVLRRPELLRTGLTGIADILQAQIVADGQSLNRNVNNGGTGELRVNLRNLGSNRTLVLVNGKRWVSALDGAVDLTAIPLALIDRVEVLQDGASAIYGSDAIAGVVNIITRRKFDGAELGVLMGGNEEGDGRQRNAAFTWGRRFGKFDLAWGIEYGKDSPILASARALSAVPMFGVPVSVSGSPATRYGYYEPAEWPWVLDGWVRIPGTSGTSPGDFRAFDYARDRNFNYAQYNYLQTPQERRTLFAQAHFDASPTLSFTFDALANQRRSAQQLAPPPISFSDYLFSGPQQFGVAADNAYNPFGMVVDTVQLRLTELADRRFEQSVITTRMHAGVEGVSTFAGRDLQWGADMVRTRAALRESTAPYADNAKLALAVGPSFFDTSNTARCGSPGNVIDGCVPLDVFGGPGAITPAMLDYIKVSEVNHKRSVTTDVTAHVSGVLADLPAGPARFAAGLEYRYESGSDRPDPMLVSGRENGSGMSLAPTAGSLSVSEAFLELDVPLLEKAPMAQELGVTIASRYSDYSLFGSTTNSKLGLRWKPVDDLLVRAGYGEGFRAPSVLEAFGGLETHNWWGALMDPCAGIGQYVPSAATLAHCAARQVPAGVSQPSLVTVGFGSSRALRPETSRTLNAGLVFSPAAVPGFSASADWYRIKVRDAMGTADPQALIDACYMDGNPGACGFVARNASGEISTVLSQQYNLPGGIEVDGWDVAVAWRRVTPVGTITLRWDNAYIDYWGEIGQPRRNSLLADGSFAEGNVAGTSNWKYGLAWRWRSVLAVAWQRAAWDASVTLRHFSPVGEDCGLVVWYASALGDPSLEKLCTAPGHTFDGEPDPRNRVPSVTYVDLSAGWHAPWKGHFALGIRNAAGRNPPVSRTAINSFFSDYDVPGRFWWMAYRQAF